MSRLYKVLDLIYFDVCTSYNLKSATNNLILKLDLFILMLPAPLLPAPSPPFPPSPHATFPRHHI
jgi:hypothetical protein